MKRCKYLRVVLKHKFHVFNACARSGIVWRGLMHDISKLSPKEFFESYKYYGFNKSVVDKEKELKGHSDVWLRHKGINKHHWSYWIDVKMGKVEIIEMPYQYMVEMVCDWIGAGKTYNDRWDLEVLRDWYYKNGDSIVMHKVNREYIDMAIERAESEEDLYKTWLSGDGKMFQLFKNLNYPNMSKVEEFHIKYFNGEEKDAG